MDPNYPSCEETRAKLLIYIEGRELEEVTNLLKLRPSYSQFKGQKTKNSLGRIRTAPCSFWELSSENKVGSKDLRHHLDWLLGKVYNKEFALKTIQKWKGTKMVISCVWWSAAGHGGPALWPKQMAAMAKLNLECDFDIYFFGPTFEA